MIDLCPRHSHGISNDKPDISLEKTTWSQTLMWWYKTLLFASSFPKAISMYHGNLRILLHIPSGADSSIIIYFWTHSFLFILSGNSRNLRQWWISRIVFGGQEGFWVESCLKRDLNNGSSIQSSEPGMELRLVSVNPSPDGALDSSVIRPQS